MAASSDAIPSGSGPSSAKTGNDIPKATTVQVQPVQPGFSEAQDQNRSNVEEFERLFGVDEDAFEQPTTTRKELWSYYLYYNGDNGVGPGSYTTALFQWALNGAGWQPGTEPRQPCTDSSPCVVPWAGGTRTVSSVVLVANGLCFTFMTIIFVWLGSAADYGTFGRWLLLVLTVVCWALQYGMMAIKHPSQWPAAMGLYVVSYIAYGATLVFYAAVFPRLARYTPHVRKAREEDLKEGKISQQEYDAIESLERNHIRYFHNPTPFHSAAAKRLYLGMLTCSIQQYIDRSQQYRLPADPIDKLECAPSTTEQSIFE
ncbi:hypothetical protein MAP00_002332 [Monascus purpureus]|nr:hypothetical protein MAP00_002332 [Monascus purpureus]